MSIVKNILQKLSGIQKELEQVALEDAKLESGQTVQANKFEVGENITVTNADGQEMGLPAGSYVLDNGIKITVDENSIITEATPADAPAADQAPPADAPNTTTTPDPNASPTNAKKTVETSSTSKETFFSKEQVEDMIATALAKQAEKESEKENAQLKEMEKLKAELSAQPAETPVSRAPKAAIDAPFYADPKTTAEKLLNFQSKLKTQN